MSVTAFLRDHPDPTDDEIREASVRQPLPLHRLPGHPAGGPPGRRRRVRRGAVVTAIGGERRRPLRRRPDQPGRGRPAAHRSRAPTSTTSRCPACCTPASCAARSPGPRSARSTRRPRCALPGVHFVFTAADLNPDVKEQWHTSIGPLSPETPRPAAGRGRGPLRRRSGRAGGRRRAATWPRTRPSWSTSTTSRCPPSSTTARPPTPTRPRPRGPRLERHRRARRPAPVGHRGRPRRRGPRGEPRRSTSRPTPRCRWRAAAWWSTAPARPAS